MIINNKLDKVFGPSGTFAGYIMIVIGIIFAFHSLGSIILIIPGAFTAFSTTGTLIDTEKKKVKYYTSYFGLTKTGKWFDINIFSEIRLSRSIISYRVYSRSNRQTETTKKGYRINFYSQEKKNQIPVMHCSDIQTARNEADKISTVTGLAITEVKRKTVR